MPARGDGEEEEGVAGRKRCSENRNNFTGLQFRGMQSVTYINDQEFCLNVVRRFTALECLIDA